MNRLSFNIRGQSVPDRRYLRDLLKAANVATAGVLDELTLAAEIKQDLPDAIVWHRAFGDSEAHMNRDPRELARRYANEGYGRLGVHAYGPNEPAPNDRISWRGIIDWLIEFAVEAEKVGVRAVLGNIGPGNIERAEIESGLWDPYLKLLSDYHGWHARGDHDYTIFPPFGGSWAGRSALDVLDAQAVKPDRWPGRADITDDTDNWHLMRGRWLNARARRLGLNVPKIVLTECFWDRMPDLEKIRAGDRERNLYAELEERFGGSGYAQLKGHNTWRAAYQNWFPDWDFDTAIYKMLAWADDVYPEEYAGFCIYMWCPDQPDWDQQYGYDVSRLTRLHELIRAHQPAATRTFGGPRPEPAPIPAPEAVPKPEPAGEAVSARVNAPYWLRQGPGKDYATVRRVDPDIELQYYPETARRDAGDELSWVFVEAGDAGWMADQGQFETGESGGTVSVLTEEEAGGSSRMTAEEDAGLDLLDYLRGDGRPWGVTHSWAGEGQMQTQDGELPDQFFLVKGMFGALCTWEELRFDDDFVYRGFDLSPDDDTVYRLTDGDNPASAWTRRRMREGDWFRREPIVTRYDAEGKVMGQAPHTTWLQVKKVHPTWTSGRGRDVPDVVELHVFDGDAGRAAGNPFEVYFYARGVGLVGWRGTIGGRPAQTDVNFIWPSKSGPGVPFLQREPLPGGLRFGPAPRRRARPTPAPTGTPRVIRPDIAWVRVREQPTTSSAEIDRLLGGMTVLFARTVDGKDRDGFRWHQRAGGGYLREDLFTDYVPVRPPIVPRGMYAAPVSGYVVTSHHGAGGHRGLDLAVPVGTPVLAGGVGQVAFLYTCTKCTAEKPTFAAHGLTPDEEVTAKNDARWGFGYGHGVVVRYAYVDLPDTARAELDRLSLQNGFVYAIYAHLSRVDVLAGQQVGAGSVLGASGNTGNSSGPHLHLETRASLKGDETSVYERMVIDPGFIFAIDHRD